MLIATTIQRLLSENNMETNTKRAGYAGRDVVYLATLAWARAIPFASC